MRISTSRSETDQTVIRVHTSRLDASVAEELRRGLSQALVAGAAYVIDLSEVSFMDSSGLGALVASLRSVGAEEVAIAGVQPAVRTVLRLTRVDRSIRVLPSAAP